MVIQSQLKFKLADTRKNKTTYLEHHHHDHDDHCYCEEHASKQGFLFPGHMIKEEE